MVWGVIAGDNATYPRSSKGTCGTMSELCVTRHAVTDADKAAANAAFPTRGSPYLSAKQDKRHGAGKNSPRLWQQGGNKCMTAPTSTIVNITNISNELVLCDG